MRRIPMIAPRSQRSSRVLTATLCFAFLLQALGFLDTIIDVVVHGDELTKVLGVPVNYHFLGSGLAVMLGTAATAVFRVVFS